MTEATWPAKPCTEKVCQPLVYKNHSTWSCAVHNLYYQTRQPWPRASVLVPGWSRGLVWWNAQHPFSTECLFYLSPRLTTLLQPHMFFLSEDFAPAPSAGTIMEGNPSHCFGSVAFPHHSFSVLTYFLHIIYCYLQSSCLYISKLACTCLPH